MAAKVKKLVTKGKKVYERKKRVHMKPMDCETNDQLCGLRSDNITAGDYWILIDGHSVHLHAQKPGHPSTASVAIPRKSFNRLIRWYAGL